MIRRATLALTLVGLVLASLGPAPARAGDDVPDTQAPQVRLNPCWDEASTCRRVYAEVYGDLETGDDLAVLGARIGDQVVAEHTYDDGSGFQPYGYFGSYGNDTFSEVDYALSVKVPSGSTDFTFYARDLAGNTREVTTTVLGPLPPGPVRKLTAERYRGRGVTVSWRLPRLKGACCAEYFIRTPGRRTKRTRSVPPGLGAHLQARYARMSPGWHRFTVTVETVGGTGPARNVRIFVPRHR